MSEVIVSFALLLFSAFFYFLPALIASGRNLKNANWIALINLFFGWTGFGWIILLVWAAFGKPKEVKEKVKYMRGRSTGWGED